MVHSYLLFLHIFQRENRIMTVATVYEANSDGRNQVSTMPSATVVLYVTAHIL